MKQKQEHEMFWFARPLLSPLSRQLSRLPAAICAEPAAKIAA